MITMIRHGAVVATGQEEIANEVDTYYSNMFGEATPGAHSVNLELLQMPSRNLSHLEDPFTKEEVEKIVNKAMPPDKAPGPDGFTGRFYASCWHVIKGDLMRALGAFHHGDMRGLPTINKAIVSFLPKKDAAVDIKDFYPVSLVNGVIKIFDKILSTRLAVEVTYLVGKHQSAFVKGWCIHDNFMLVQCIAWSLHTLWDPAVVLKLDISKAFDSVQWPFLVEVLNSMGFGNRWLAWICGVLANSSMRIMVMSLP